MRYPSLLLGCSRLTSSLFTFCVIYGFFAAGVQSFLPPACASLTSDLTSTECGQACVFRRFCCLFNRSTHSGHFDPKRDDRFLFTQAFGGSAFIGLSHIECGERCENGIGIEISHVDAWIRHVRRCLSLHANVGTQ